MLWVAASPLLSLWLLLVVLRLPARKAMPLALLGCSLLAVWVWQMPVLALAMALYSSLGLALQIVVILTAALAWLRYLRLSGGEQRLLQLLQVNGQGPSLSLTLLLAWLLLAFLEGVSGFGAPAIIVASLLIALGYAPVLAIALVLLGGNSAVSFGALATPIWLGIGGAWPQVLDSQLQALAWRVAWHEVLLTPVVPLLLAVTHAAVLRQWQALRALLPLVLLLAVLYPWLALLVQAVLGMAFVSVITPILVAGAWWALLRARGALNGWPSRAQLWSALTPWLALVLVLLLWRAPFLPWSAWLQQQQWLWPVAVEPQWQLPMRWLMSPAWPMLLLVVGLSVRQRLLRPMFRLADDRHPSLWSSLMPGAFAVLMAVPLMRIFALSEHNLAGLPSMADFLVAHWQSWGNPWWLSPMMAALGSSSAGSATYGHLLVVPLQLSMAQTFDWPLSVVLSLQMLGANAGNMLNFPLLISLCALYRQAGSEGRVLVYVLPGFVVYGSLIVLQAGFLLAF